MSPAELAAEWEARAVHAEGIGATAPVASLFRALAEELRTLDGGQQSSPAVAPVNQSADDTLLTVEQTAELLNVNKRWVYEHKDRLPVVRPAGTRTIRISKRRLERQLERNLASP